MCTSLVDTPARRHFPRLPSTPPLRLPSWLLPMASTRTPSSHLSAVDPPVADIFIDSDYPKISSRATGLERQG